jgi:glycosyltransferase involved in cell wall biosynthesis
MATDAIRLIELPRRRPDALEVLFITNLWPDEQRPYYGSFIHSQARSLSQAGVAVDVLYVRGYLAPARVYARALTAIPAVARRKAYDLVHIHYGHTALAGIAMPRRPLVTSFCGEDLLGAPREHGITAKSRAEVAVFRQVARLATRTITKSEEMERALPAAVRARNHVLPNGVDLEHFAPRPRAAARAELGWPQDAKVMLFLGNPDDPRKNVALARAAARIVARRVPGAHLHVAWGVTPAEVPVLMNAADCLLFASRSEGSPNAIKEAMACELPIVSTAVGDVPERLRGVEGTWIRDPTPEAFADALIAALAARRAPAARRAVEALGLDRVADRLLEIYERACHQPGGAPIPVTEGR